MSASGCWPRTSAAICSASAWVSSRNWVLRISAMPLRSGLKRLGMGGLLEEGAHELFRAARVAVAGEELGAGGVADHSRFARLRGMPEVDEVGAAAPWAADEGAERGRPGVVF